MELFCIFGTILTCDDGVGGYPPQRPKPRERWQQVYDETEKVITL